MLPRPCEKVPSKGEAMMFMMKYLMLIGIPFKAEYDDDVLMFIRIRQYKIYDEEIISDVKNLCCQLGGYFSDSSQGDISTYLDLEWS